MWNAIIDGAMPQFWPPRANRFWRTTLDPWRRWYLGRYYGIVEVVVDRSEQFGQGMSPGDGVLIAPNHSHDSDPHVMMEVGRRLRRQLYFMAAWQIFRPHWGLDGWVLQRMGAFSVDREGCDRRALHQASEILSTGRALVVFPEGEVYRLNDRLTPLLDGVAFMALSAQRDLAKKGGGHKVWIVPTAIRYRYLDAIEPKLTAAVERLENQMRYKPPHGTSLAERILHYGELLLTIKEKEKFGRSFENEGDLPTRINRLTEMLLERHEQKHLERSPSAETVALRVKALRRKLFELWTDEASDAETRRLAREALDDVQLALQAYSYPGNYIAEKPSIERMAETIEKLEEDFDGFARPKGRRRARVVFGPPIELSQASANGRPRAVAAEITDRLEAAIRDMLSRETA